MRTQKKPQISPLRCGSVEMTNLLQGNGILSQSTNGSTALKKFVSTVGVMGKVMKNAFGPTTPFHGSIALPFVIPSEAEGSAVPRTSPGNVFDRARSKLWLKPNSAY